MTMLSATTQLASDWSWFSSRTFAEATLIAIAAIVVGYVVRRFWPKGANPDLFGTLVAIALVAGLAYLGSTGAGVALVFIILIAVLLAFAGVIW